MKTLLCAVALVLLIDCAASAAEPRSLAFSKRTTIRLATQEEGRALIARRDDFLAALSLFDLQSRLKSDRADLTADDLVALYQEHVTEWPAADAAKVLSACEYVAGQLRAYDLPLPETVSIVRTTGKEESGAAYCRGPAIVLPANLTGQGEAGLRRLVAHELFHVLSSHNMELRRDLYRIIGFTLCDPIPPPAALAERTIANPDAPRIDCVIELTLADGAQVTAAPLLIASPAKYDAVAKKSMFAYLQFKLLVVEKQDGGFRAVEKEREPYLLEPRTLADFHKQIGKNTGYIIHPDEIMADNFVHVVMETAKLASPEIVEQMKARLAK